MTTEPVGLAQDLDAQRVMRAQVGEQDLAIWRSASLTVQAWANRCPHRGMRLSYGFVRGDSLACAYHGWHYNCQATCHYIPAHPELEPPATIKPTVFSVAEQHGILWVSTDDAADPVSLPDSCTGIRTISLDCRLADAVKAFSVASLEDESHNCLNVREYCAQPRILSYGVTDNPVAVLVLFQQSGTDSVNAHILANAYWSEQGRLKISRWSEAVRRLAENSDLIHPASMSSEQP